MLKVQRRFEGDVRVHVVEVHGPRNQQTAKRRKSIQKRRLQKLIRALGGVQKDVCRENEGDLLKRRNSK